MLWSWQTDRRYVVRELDRTVQLHQGDVVVKIVGVVVRMGDDPLYVLLYNIIPNVSLDVKAKVSFPCSRLRESNNI